MRKTSFNPLWPEHDSRREFAELVERTVTDLTKRGKYADAHGILDAAEKCIDREDAELRARLNCAWPGAPAAAPAAVGARTNTANVPVSIGFRSAWPGAPEGAFSGPPAPIPYESWGNQ